MTVNLNEWTDSISGSRGNLRDGYTLCGTRDFRLEPTGATPPNAFTSYAFASYDTSGNPTASKYQVDATSDS